MVELRKRPAPPAAAPPAKKKAAAKPAATKPAAAPKAAAKGKGKKAAEPAAEEAPEIAEEAPAAAEPEPAPEPVAESSAEKVAKGTVAKQGETVDLEGFGGEVETNDGAKTTLAALVGESKAGVVLFTYPKASTPGCKHLSFVS